MKKTLLTLAFAASSLAAPGLAAEPATVTPVSYTHLTLPTNREV